MAMATLTQAEREILDLLSHRPTPQEVIAFHPSKEATERAYDLIEREREQSLTDEEEHELDIYLYLEHFMGMLKIEAHRQIGASDAIADTETRAEREVIQFLAGRPSPEQIVAFRLSPEVNARFYRLIDTERDGLATEAERKELDNCLYLEHLMRMIKAEAHRQIQQQAS